MTTLTINPMRSYSRPKPHYPVRGDWYATTTWELADGIYKRMFRSPSTGRVRGAFVERALGGWRWRIQERSVRGAGTDVLRRGGSGGDNQVTGESEYGTGNR